MITISPILYIALSFITIALAYQIIKFASRVVKFVTRPWRPLDIPDGVSFVLVATPTGGLEKTVRLDFNGHYRHHHPITYKGNPVRNMRKTQRILLKRFKATSMCQKYERKAAK